ncbi:MAG: hypothetical protein HY821_11670 [Acidobacteria bacterium]|nr:hypothetical protein [Acidobacteriota bacterium]
MGQPDLTELIGEIPLRMALAGGWIDQPFISRLNPQPPGSMVVVALEPDVWLMDRCGFASGTRKIARRIWNGRLPERPREELVRELYWAENRGKDEPSGSQDMIGLIYPGINRLDYDFEFEGGYFPRHIESCTDEGVARWLERVFCMVPIQPRPPGYNPLGIKNLSPEVIARLGQTGKDCFDAIVRRDVARLGAAMNECMECWESLLPQVVAHPTIDLDLKAILRHYQRRYPGAMYSGCGGGYLFVAAEDAVPGSLRVTVKTH